MTKMLLSFFSAMLLTALIGYFLVKLLRRIKAGQSIREDGPVWHKSKAGTPTMGGLMFIAAIAVVCLTVGLPDMLLGEFGHVIVLCFALVFAAIGFLDDFQKLKKKQNMGLSALQKFLLQLAAAVVLVLLLRYTGHLSPELYVPFFGVTWQLNDVVYLAFAAFVIVGTVNAVNITDGVDGLVTGVSLPVAICYAAVTFVWGARYAALNVFASALAGGLAGFLIYNFHPAKVFMGDTGSLFLGGTVCAMAFAINMPLLLLPLGIVYIVETLSDIIQVIYFKATHGKRLFKMAPLHHHFEMCGWSEYKIFTVFSLVSAAFAVLSFFDAAGRFLF